VRWVISPSRSSLRRRDDDPRGQEDSGVANAVKGSGTPVRKSWYPPSRSVRPRRARSICPIVCPPLSSSDGCNTASDDPGRPRCSRGALAHDFEDAHPGLDLGWEPVVGKGPRRLRKQRGWYSKKAISHWWRNRRHLPTAHQNEAAKPRGRRAANANDAAMRLVPIAGIGPHNS